MVRSLAAKALRQLSRPAPGSSLTGRIGRQHRYAWARAALDGIKTINQELRRTVNHVRLAAISDGSRSLLACGGHTTAAALAAVRKIATSYSGTSVMHQNAYRQSRVKPIQQELMLVYALLALAILIALLGIGNTLALSIYERTRELGVTRAVGMTRAQLRAMIRCESVIIALQGTVLGPLVGVFFGWALVLAMRNQGITVFSLPVPSLVLVLVLAGLAGVVAAIGPSRRARKLSIMHAIVSE